MPKLILLTATFLLCSYLTFFFPGPVFLFSEAIRLLFFWIMCLIIMLLKHSSTTSILFQSALWGHADLSLSHDFNTTVVSSVLQ